MGDVGPAGKPGPQMIAIHHRPDFRWNTRGL